MNGAESLLRTAAGAGVEVCFANPGTTEMPLVAAFDAVPEVRAVLGIFEGVCTGAADGYGRLTGRPALTLLHLGPGFANGIANLHNARRARTPVVNLIGDQASWHLDHDAPLTSDIASLARPVSRWVHQSQSARDLASDLAEAIGRSTAPPGGVSSLILPADFQAEGAAGPVVVEAPASRTAVPDARIADLASRLREARQAMILLGGAALDERSQNAAGRIMAASSAHVLCETFPACWERGSGLPGVSRLPYFPEQAREVLAPCDLVILADAREPVAFFGYAGQASRLAPDQSCHVLAGGHEEVSAALEALADALDAPSPPAISHALPDPASGALDPLAIGVTLARCLPEGAIVVDEAATSGLPFYACSLGSPRHTLLALTGGAIGQGLPCAVGAAIARPDRKVVAFQADGSALYTAQALWTCARESLDVVALLCSNRSYRILQIELARAGIAEPGRQARSLTSLEEPAIDWVSLARGYGVPGERVETAEELAKALPRALAEPGPQLLELVL